jgi:hypothetical protein
MRSPFASRVEIDSTHVRRETARKVIQFGLGPRAEQAVQKRVRAANGDRRHLAGLKAAVRDSPKAVPMLREEGERVLRKRASPPR